MMRAALHALCHFNSQVEKLISSHGLKPSTLSLTSFKTVGKSQHGDDPILFSHVLVKPPGEDKGLWCGPLRAPEKIMTLSSTARISSGPSGPVRIDLNTFSQPTSVPEHRSINDHERLFCIDSYMCRPLEHSEMPKFGDQVNWVICTDAFYFIYKVLHIYILTDR